MSALPTRKLGKNGPQVPALGFGLMGLSTSYGQPGSDEDRMKLLDRAHELGEVFWDTADVYGDNEELLGKWFNKTGKRNEVNTCNATNRKTFTGALTLWARSSLPPSLPFNSMRLPIL